MRTASGGQRDRFTFIPRSSQSVQTFYVTPKRWPQPKKPDARRSIIRIGPVRTSGITSVISGLLAASWGFRYTYRFKKKNTNCSNDTQPKRTSHTGEIFERFSKQYLALNNKLASGSYFNQLWVNNNSFQPTLHSHHKPIKHTHNKTPNAHTNIILNLEILDIKIHYKTIN